MRLTPEQTKRLQQAFSYLTNFEGDDPTAPIDPSTYRLPDGDRLIHIAAQRGDLASVELLLAAGEDVNAVGDMGQTPAHRAARGQHREVFDLLLSSGADEIVDEFGQTPRQTWDSSVFAFDKWADWLKSETDRLKGAGFTYRYSDNRDLPECASNPSFGVETETEKSLGWLRYWKNGLCDYQVHEKATMKVLADEAMLKASDETVPILFARFRSLIEADRP